LHKQLMIFKRMGADMTRKVSAAKSNISSKFSPFAAGFLVVLAAAF